VLDLCCSIFSFLCSVLLTTVSTFFILLFRLPVVLSVFRLTASDYTFGFLKLFLEICQISPSLVLYFTNRGRAIVLSGIFDNLDPILPKTSELDNHI
jgi:hypothetical protein